MERQGCIYKNGINYNQITTLKRYTLYLTLFFSFILLFQPCLSSAGDAKTGYFRAEGAYKSLRNNPARQKYRQFWLECIDKFQKVYREDPSGPWASASLYMAGNLYIELHKRSLKSSDKNEAIDIFERITKRFPDSKYAARAREEIEKNTAVVSTEKPVDETSATPDKSKTAAIEDSAVQTKTITPKASELQDSIKEIIAQAAVQEQGAKENTDSKNSGIATIRDLRHWSNPNYTRIVIDADNETLYTPKLLRQDPSIDKPQRLFVDFKNSKLGSNIKKVIPINDDLLSSARAGQYEPETVRVVVDIKSFKTYKIFSLKNPFRVVIDVWGSSDETGKNADAASESREKIIRPGDLCKQFALGVKKITIDMGHGGQDFGAPGYIKGIHEKNIVLTLGAKLAKKIREELHCEVVMTRKSDKYLTLEERTAIANTKNSDLFISIHANASRNKEAYGIETYFLNLATDNDAIQLAARENATSTKNISDLQTILNDLMQNSKINESSRLASLVQESICKHLSSKYDMIKNKGVKQAPFYVLLGAQMPAILIETSFISNKRECKRLTDSKYQDMICEGIVNGIRSYINEINPTAFLRESCAKGG
ncbi:N-acetylmuramoyl-L-alanine amidase [Desulfobacterium sp. N47]|uniref:N-acetylmuramoyl-L-alanine amidase n=1 Tax=Desulfobacterium sp. N47 TaxID=3115210 RepID=UPI003F4A7538